MILDGGGRLEASRCSLPMIEEVATETCWLSIGIDPSLGLLAVSFKHEGTPYRYIAQKTNHNSKMKTVQIPFSP